MWSPLRRFRSLFNPAGPLGLRGFFNFNFNKTVRSSLRRFTAAQFRVSKDHTSENKASTISRHFEPGITLRSIWFIT